MNPFLGEIRLMSFIFAPKGWAQCNGQIMSIQQNTALFALLGTTYGGNGVQTFALPDLRGRAGLHVSPQIVQGEMAGVENVTLLSSMIPQHNHAFNGTSVAGGARTPGNGLLAQPPSTSTNAYYAADSNALQPLFASSIQPPSGSGQPHTNMQPYLVMNYCIALTGIFPSRN